MKNILHNIRCSTALLLFIATSSGLSAQRGIPPREKTSSKLVTNYSQHIDFLPEMVKLLKVPDGWEVSVAASGVGKARMLYEIPGKGLYVTRRDAGDVLLLKDENHDNAFDDIQTVISDFKGVHGITARDGWMYLCNNNELRRYKLNPDGTFGVSEVLIDDLPDGGQHPNRTIGFGPDGMLYISVGTQCNDCKENDSEVASMLQVNPSTWERKIYASGLRNTIGFDWHPQTKEMWGIDNGGDGKGNNWPPEEVNRIIEGGNYGFPFVYGKQEVDESREDPAGNSKEAFAKMTVPSVLELQAHSAPIGFRFFDNAANIPTDYSGDALVCWHGSWNRRKPVGFKVQRITFTNGVATGAEDFLTGFAKVNKRTRFGRPAGIAITSEGKVFISDDANGVIYCVKRL